MAEISDTGRPTPTERAALFEYDQETTDCARNALDIASSSPHSDSVVGLFREARLAAVNQMKLLADGQITYGQYRANTYQILSKAQQVVGDYERAQQIANAASQQAAAANLSAATQSFQTFNRQPSVTTCNSLGSNVTCVSR